MNMKTFKNLIELITSKYENVKSINTEENNTWTILFGNGLYRYYCSRRNRNYIFYEYDESNKVTFKSLKSLYDFINEL